MCYRRRVGSPSIAGRLRCCALRVRCTGPLLAIPDVRAAPGLRKACRAGLAGSAEVTPPAHSRVAVPRAGSVLAETPARASF